MTNPVFPDTSFQRSSTQYQKKDSSEKTLSTQPLYLPPRGSEKDRPPPVQPQPKKSKKHLKNSQGDIQNPLTNKGEKYLGLLTNKLDI